MASGQEKKIWDAIDELNRKLDDVLKQLKALQGQVKGSIG